MFVRDRKAGGEQHCLLFLHGLGESGLCFEHLLSHHGLRSWRLLIPDLPGYGRSPWSPKPLSLMEQADLLADWLHQEQAVRGALPVVVVGHSMAGVTALLLCERHPDVVAALVDIDGNKSLGDCVFSSRAAEQDLEAFLGGGFDRLRQSVFAAGRQDPAQRGYYVSMRLADPQAYHLNSRELVAMSAKEDMATRMAALPVPAHYIAGVPRGACSHTLELLKKANVPCLRIEPSGHWPFIDQPDVFVKTLIKLTLR
jgi:pimeloyl-ACP methyl ester carboxylesterase